MTDPLRFHLPATQTHMGALAEHKLECSCVHYVAAAAAGGVWNNM